MIQRIQSVYLFLSALLMGLLWILPLGHAVNPADHSVIRIMIWGYDYPSHVCIPMVFGLSTGSCILAAFSIVMSIFTIFMYKNRTFQKRLCKIQILLLLILTGGLFYYLNLLKETIYETLAWSVTLVFPVICIVLIGLAHRGIAKDDKLIRSLDRIR